MVPTSGYIGLNGCLLEVEMVLGHSTVEFLIRRLVNIAVVIVERVGIIHFLRCRTGTSSFERGCWNLLRVLDILIDDLHGLHTVFHLAIYTH